MSSATELAAILGLSPDKTQALVGWLTSQPQVAPRPMTPTEAYWKNIEMQKLAEAQAASMEASLAARLPSYAAAQATLEGLALDKIINAGSNPNEVDLAEVMAAQQFIAPRLNSMTRSAPVATQQARPPQPQPQPQPNLGPLMEAVRADKASKMFVGNVALYGLGMTLGAAAGVAATALTGFTMPVIIGAGAGGVMAGAGATWMVTALAAEQTAIQMRLAPG